MDTSVQLCGLLLYALCSLAASQSQERVWHSTTPPVSITSTSPDDVLTYTTITPAIGQVEEVAAITSPLDTVEEKDTITPEDTILNTDDVFTHDNTDDNVPAASGVVPEEEAADSEKPKEDVIEVEEIASDVSVPLPDKEENTTESKKSKPRKWMSVPEEVEEVPTDAPVPTEEEQPETQTEKQSDTAPSEEVDEYALNESDFELPKNISELLEAAEEGTPMVQETIISKKTTVYVTITESLGDNEPLYVNLTGIRDFTGQERRIVAGCLDLSDLMITGEEAKEIIQRMAKHKFHRLDLSNNNINEFPTNTFSPVAFTVKELRLDGNPLLSNSHSEGGMLERGGLFHLTELRELNLSSCGLRDIDFFTPWNSNRLEVVDLSANNLRSVPTNLQFFHKLKKLYLDGNPITEVSELPFALLWNLQTLSLSGCSLTTISSDPFRNMEHLKELSLEGNNLTRISDVRLPRGSSGVKMYLSGNPWHCACDMLKFIEYHHYAIRDLEDIRCATPRWLEGLRTAYLTKEILSLDSVDGDCSPAHHEVLAPVAHTYPTVRADRLELLSLGVFGLAAFFMLIHIFYSKRKDKYKFDDDRHDINYIRIDRKPSFK